MRWRLGVLAMLAFGGPSAAEVPIDGAGKPLPANSFAVLSVKAGPGDRVIWAVTPEPVRSETIGGKFVLSGPPGSRYKVTATAINFEAKTVEQGAATVTFGGDTDPPEPGPDPKPTPTPAPVGFRVIFVYESSATATREQENVLNSTAIAAYLTAKAAKGDDGVPAWRRWDKDVDVTKETPAMRELWAAVKPSLPALPVVVVASNGKAEIFPLPATEAETLALLKRFGG